MENNPNKKGADKILSGYYYDEKSVEEAESFLQKTSFNLLLKKSKLKKENIDLLISSDLQSQLLASHLAFKNNDIPFLGIYSACASFTEALIIASCLLNNKAVNNICVNSSSHNLASERTFRFPIEYGFSPKKTSSFTTTGSASTLLSSTPSKIKVESATIGEVVDIGFKDVNNMGAAMVPSAAKVIFNHFKNNKRKPEYYDIILTGDLGRYGSLILKEYLDKEFSLIEKNLIYEYKKTLPETKIKEEKLKKERDEEYKKLKEYELNFMKEHYPEYLEGGYFKSDEFKQIYDKVSEYAKEQVAMDHGNGHKTYPMNPRRYFEIIRTVLKRDYNIDWKDRDTIWKEMHPDGYIIY